MKYHSEICEVMHQEAMADYKAGAISEARMKEYDEMCLVQEDKPAYEAKKEPVTMQHANA